MCPTCGAMIDEDFDVEHYEICEAEQKEFDAKLKEKEEVKERVKELMIKQDLDISNEILVLSISTIYMTGQTDLLFEQLTQQC